MTDDRTDAVEYVEKAVAGVTRVYGAVQRWKWRGIAVLFLAAAGLVWLIAETTETAPLRIAAAVVAGVGVLVWLARGRK